MFSSRVFFLILFSAVFTIKADIVHYWKFDESALDCITGHEAKLNGSPTWCNDRFGRKSKAIYFNSSKDSAVLSNSDTVVFGSGDKDRPFSFSWWQKIDSPPKAPHGSAVAILTKDGEYVIKGDNSFRVRLKDGNTDRSMQKAVRVKWKEGQWTHIVMTYDGSSTVEGMKFYQNGMAVDSLSEGVSRYIAMSDKGGPLILGATSPKMTFKGAIDELMIFDSVLTKDNVFNLYNGNSIDSTDKDLIDTIYVKDVPLISIDGSFSEIERDKLKWYGLKSCTEPDKKIRPVFFTIGNSCNFLYYAFKLNISEIENYNSFIELSIISAPDKTSLINIDLSSRSVYATDQSLDKYLKKVFSDEISGQLNIELAIPYSSLPMPNNSDFSWESAIKLTCLDDEQSISIYQHTAKDAYCNWTGSLYHRLFFNSNAFLKPLLLNIQLEKIQPLVLSGQKFNSFEFEIENYGSSKEVDINVSTLHHNCISKNVSKRQSFSKGTHKVDINIPFGINNKGMHGLEVSVNDMATGQKVLGRYYSVDLEDIVFSPILIEPKYQNTIYVGQDIQNIAVDLESDCIVDRLDYKYVISLKSSSQVIWVEDNDVLGQKTRIYIPVPSKDGKYQIISKLVYRPTQKIIAKSDTSFFKAPFKENQVYFDANHVCYIDDEAFLPFGIFGDCGMENKPSDPGWSLVGPKGIWDAADWGMNSCENAGASYLDEAEKAGLKCFVLPFPMEESFPLPMMGRVIDNYSESQKQAIREHVRKYKDHPALLGWYIGNEPSVGKISSELLKEVSGIVYEEDPYHPTLMINHSTESIEHFANTTSLLMPDPYPGYVKGGGAVNPKVVANYVNTARVASKENIPVWVLMQAHNLALFGSSENRAPYFSELRNQLYQSVIAGAKGFFWYARYWIEPHVIHSLSFLSNEANLLGNAILFGEIESSIRVDEAGLLQTLCKKFDNEIFFFAVNSSDKKQLISIKVDDPVISKIYVVSEKRFLEVKNNRFSDVFEPYDTHIYTTSFDKASKLSISEVQDRIKSDCLRAKIKSDNHANLKNGIKITSSWKIKYPQRPQLTSMIDGIKESSCWSQGELPCWVELDYSKPVTFQQIVIDSNISKIAVEVLKNGKWQRIGGKEFLQKNRRARQTVEVEPTTAKKMRILSMEVKGINPDIASCTEIWEIEVY